MRFTSPLSSRAMLWSWHRHAPWYLGGISFAESSLYPVPPDVMLAPTRKRTDRIYADAGCCDGCNP